MPSKSGCSPVELCRAGGRPPRSAWPASGANNKHVDTRLPTRQRAGDPQGHLKVSPGQVNVDQGDGGSSASSSRVCDDVTGTPPVTAALPACRPPRCRSRPNGDALLINQLSTFTDAGSTLPGDMSRAASDHVTGGDTGTGRSGADAETPGCFACIALCHAKDSRKSGKRPFILRL